MAGNSEDTFSMVDVLEEDRELEEEANAVLGASDDQNCTYPQGYIDRQALYSCLTCCPEEECLAGICFACSLHCHDGHNLVELYTKRNFCCDCGNSKFNGFQCKLFAEKSSENKSNKYNQNFRGIYCTCKRPYPDPDDEIEDEMIQCVVCEDWYHSRHLGALPPADYSELICDACIQKLDFLRWYKSVSVSSHEISPGKALAKSRDNSNGTGHVGKSGICEGAPSSKKHDGFLGGESNKEEPVTLDQQEAPKKEGPNEGEQPVKNCKLHSLKIGNEAFDDKASIQALFWPSHWRKILCKCAECKDLYNLKGAPFIISEEDTVSAYEEKGKKMHESNTAYDKGMRAFSSMDRINQVEVLTEYNDMKSQLHEFLGRFAGDGKVVTKEDIEEFFAGMKAKKRRRLDDGSTSFQYHCR